MNIIFGIDVSSHSSNICVLFGDNKQEFKITNDTPGFNYLLKNLKVFAEHPQIIFESTGVYSRRLETFLEAYNYEYVVINPLKAKKEMDTSLRHNKNDRVDAYRLAKIQLLHHHQVLKRESQAYKDMRSLDRFYEELTADIVKAKKSQAWADAFA